MYLTFNFITPSFDFELDLANIDALIPMNFAVEKSFVAVGYGCRAATQLQLGI